MPETSRAGCGVVALSTVLATIQQAMHDRLCAFWSGAHRWRVTLALVVASLLWGSLYPAAKPALAATGPMQVTFCRVLLAFVSLPDLVFGAGNAADLSPLGIGLSLAGSGVIAIGTGVGRRVMLGGDPLVITTLALGAAILPMSALTLANGGFDPLLNAPGDIQLLLL